MSIAAAHRPAAETLLGPSPSAYTRTTRALTGHQPRAAGRKRVEPDGARTVRGATSGRRLRQLGWYHGSRRPETSGRRFCLEKEVERELNLNSKRDIETYGIGKFSDACRARVDRSAAAITKGSIRMGQWMDWAHSYFTYSDLNISHIWHVLKVCQERGWLYKGHRSMPWCARCGTALSQHEMIDSYREMTHLSVYVRFPIEGRKN